MFYCQAVYSCIISDCACDFIHSSTPIIPGFFCALVLTYFLLPRLFFPLYYLFYSTVSYLFTFLCNHPVFFCTPIFCFFSFSLFLLSSLTFAASGPSLILVEHLLLSPNLSSYMPLCSFLSSPLPTIFLFSCPSVHFSYLCSVSAISHFSLGTRSLML